eukprot:5028112-Amphidinium_carterae.1
MIAIDELTLQGIGHLCVKLRQTDQLEDELTLALVRNTPRSCCASNANHAQNLDSLLCCTTYWWQELYVSPVGRNGFQARPELELSRATSAKKNNVQ